MFLVLNVLGAHCLAISRQRSRDLTHRLAKLHETVTPIQVLQRLTNLLLTLRRGPTGDRIGNLREARACIRVINVDGRAVPKDFTYGGGVGTLPTTVTPEARASVQRPVMYSLVG